MQLGFKSLYYNWVLNAVIKWFLSAQNCQKYCRVFGVYLLLNSWKGNIEFYLNDYFSVLHEDIKGDYEYNIWTSPDCSGTPHENGNRCCIVLYIYFCFLKSQVLFLMWSLNCVASVTWSVIYACPQNLYVPKKTSPSLVPR